MTSLADYQTKYKTIVLRREDGILEMRFHTEGGPLRWGFLPHEEAEDAFLHIGRDRENKVVIMTGTGAEFSGPALRHAELPVMCDIVLAADTAEFQDSAHFTGGLVPGDGVHVVFPMVMGLNRGRYFLLTGQRLNAQQAKEYGLVNEILRSAALLPRAWELARVILRQPEMNRRYARLLLTEQLRRQMNELLPLGLALEG